MRSIVLEDNSNSLRYWIYTLIITTNVWIKEDLIARPRALHRALLFADSFRRFSASLPHSPLFFHITQASCAVFCFSFYLVPHQVSNHLPFAYISPTSLSSIPLHHESQLRFIPPKLIFIPLDSLACPKIYITIYINIYCMLHACCTLHENMHRICGSLRNKRWRRWFIFSPNRFHLSWPSSYKVPFSYINTMSSLNFLPRGLCRQNDESSCGANRRTRYDCWDWWV